MFLRKENHQPYLELLPKSPVANQPEISTLFSSLALSLEAEKAVENVAKRNPLLRVLKPTKEQPIDPIVSYLRRFLGYEINEMSIEQATTDAERAAILVPDFSHIIWEMLEAKKETVFNLELNNEAGFGDGYKESMELQFSNFVHLIKKQGLLASRGFLELIMFQRVYNQLFGAAQNHIDTLSDSNKLTTLIPPIAVMVTSPPDRHDAGYHGANSLNNWNAPENHHSFHFVYIIDKIQTTKNKDGKLIVTNASVKVTQFRTWHNIQGLLDLHNRLNAPLEIDSKMPVTNQILANAIHFKFPESDSQQDILDYFRKELYVGEKKWAKNSEQMPEIAPKSKEAFELELGMISEKDYVVLKKKLKNNERLNDDEKLNDFELKILQRYPTVESLRANSFFHKVYLQPVLRLLKNASSEQIQDSVLREQLTEQLKLRSQVFLQAVELRVRELNTNPEYIKLVEKNLIYSIFKNPLQLPSILKQLQQLSSEEATLPLTHSKRLETIVQSHHLIEQTTIFGKELSKDQQNWLAENFSSVFAIGNYTVGSMQCYAIGTLQLPMKMADLSAGASFSPMMIEALSQVDTATKKQLLKDLEQQHYVELDLPGANRIWMVPASYLTKPGCRVDENGMVCGPCITKDFPLGIPFDHPLEQINPLGPLPMNKLQFNDYLKQLKENILQDQLEDQLDFDQLSQEDQAKSRLLIKRLVKILFKVNLSNFVAGIDEQTEEAFKLPQDKLRKITSVEALQKLVLELEQSDDETAQSELDELLETVATA